MTDSSPQPSAFTLYDLHSHTTASDGYLTPAQLVQRAVEMRVGVLAITDHDTTEGLAAAAATIAELSLPLQLVNGVEISTLWENHEIHIVGLGIETAHPAMVQLLADQTERRNLRAQEIGVRLAKARIDGAFEGAQKLADGGAVTRGHFARYLVQIGIADNMAQVFKKYLAKGKTGYVPPQWCTIKQAIDVIHQSGGQAVIAHPGRYDLTAKWLKRLLAHFAEQGGMPWRLPSVSRHRMSVRNWQSMRRNINYWRRRALTFISPARGSNWAANCGYPAGLNPCGVTGHNRSRARSVDLTWAMPPACIIFRSKS